MSFSIRHLSLTGYHISLSESAPKLRVKSHYYTCLWLGATSVCPLLHYPHPSVPPFSLAMYHWRNQIPLTSNVSLTGELNPYIFVFYTSVHDWKSHLSAPIDPNMTLTGEPNPTAMFLKRTTSACPHLQNLHPSEEPNPSILSSQNCPSCPYLLHSCPWLEATFVCPLLHNLHPSVSPSSTFHHQRAKSLCPHIPKLSLKGEQSPSCPYLLNICPWLETTSVYPLLYNPHPFVPISSPVHQWGVNPSVPLAPKVSLTGEKSPSCPSFSAKHLSMTVFHNPSVSFLPQNCPSLGSWILLPFPATHLSLTGSHICLSSPAKPKSLRPPKLSFIGEIKPYFPLCYTSFLGAKYVFCTTHIFIFFCSPQSKPFLFLTPQNCPSPES